MTGPLIWPVNRQCAVLPQAEARTRRDAALQPCADVHALIPEYRAALQQLRGQLDLARAQLDEAQADNKTLEQQVRCGEVQVVMTRHNLWALLRSTVCIAGWRCRVSKQCA